MKWMVLFLVLGAFACRTPGPVQPDESGGRVPVNKTIPPEVANQPKTP